MNVTEQFLEILRLAKLAPVEAHGRGSAAALRAFEGRVRRMHMKLTKDRRWKQRERVKMDSTARTLGELRALKNCHVCGWEAAVPGQHWPENPLRKCTGEFGCAMDCLRYRSCEWWPGMLDGAPRQLTDVHSNTPHEHP